MSAKMTYRISGKDSNNRQIYALYIGNRIIASCVPKQTALTITERYNSYEDLIESVNLKEN